MIARALRRRASFARRHEHRPPGPRPRYPGQLIVALATDKLGLFEELARHGDVAEVFFGPQRVVQLMHPEDIRRVLVTEQRNFVKSGTAVDHLKTLLGNGLLTSEGESHLRQRRLVQPAFHRERVAAYGEVMTRYAERTQARWRDGAQVDVHAEMMRLTLAVAGRTLFDTDVEGEAHDVAEAMELSLRMFGYAILPFGTLMEWAPFRWVRDLHRARRRLDALILRLVAERRASGRDRGDLLSTLIAARDAEGDGSGMTDQQLRDEIVTLLMAGHETTANALTWAWYLLSRHPQAEAALHAELARVLGGRLPTVEDLPRLEYTRRVLAEAMRLYPPAWMIERRPLEDFEAGGYVIPSGTIVLMSQYLVHRDRRWWREPERFDPDRWTPEQQALRPKFAYFPFGGGARMCVGEHFAWMEGVLVLATIAQRWRMRHDAPVNPEPEPLVTMRPKGGMPMRLVRRAED